MLIMHKSLLEHHIKFNYADVSSFLRIVQARIYIHLSIVVRSKKKRIECFLLWRI